MSHFFQKLQINCLYIYILVNSIRINLFEFTTREMKLPGFLFFNKILKFFIYVPHGTFSLSVLALLRLFPTVTFFIRLPDNFYFSKELKYHALLLYYTLVLKEVLTLSISIMSREVRPVRVFLNYFKNVRHLYLRPRDALIDIKIFGCFFYLYSFYYFLFLIGQNLNFTPFKWIHKSIECHLAKSKQSLSQKLRQTIYFFRALF